MVKARASSQMSVQFYAPKFQPQSRPCCCGGTLWSQLQTWGLRICKLPWHRITGIQQCIQHEETSHQALHLPKLWVHWHATHVPAWAKAWSQTSPWPLHALWHWGCLEDPGQGKPTQHGRNEWIVTTLHHLLHLSWSPSWNKDTCRHVLHSESIQFHRHAV